MAEPVMSQICHEMTSQVFGVTSSHDVTLLHQNQGCVQPEAVCQVVCTCVKNTINIPKIPHMSHMDLSSCTSQEMMLILFWYWVMASEL